MTGNERTGVWLSDSPLDANEGAAGRYVLAVDIPEYIAARYEWVEEGKGFREFLVPARVVNKYGPPTIEDDEGPSPPWKV